MTCVMRSSDDEAYYIAWNAEIIKRSHDEMQHALSKLGTHLLQLCLQLG